METAKSMSLAAHRTRPPKARGRKTAGRPGKNESLKLVLSHAPDGSGFELPSAEQAIKEERRLVAKIDLQQSRGRKIVLVQGLGFVGSAVAAVVASARDLAGQPLYHVVGVDLPTVGAYWKIAKLNKGLVPFPSPDPNFTSLVHDAVKRTGNLQVTYSEAAYGRADVIIMDVGLDVRERYVTNPRKIHLNMEAFRAALRVVGRHMKADALVLVETTVPMGTCERIAVPTLKEERRRRGITEPLRLAHAYERVMPGPNYINSIRSFWRSFSGVDRESAALARSFLSTFIDTTSHPLCELNKPVASELAKLIENSYRALNIAFMHEWTLLAEKIGVNMFAVVESIRVRKGTHDNMRYPGFGVGGYCLTKDSLLAQWSALNLFDTGVTLHMTLEALRVNHDMPLHTFDLLRDIARRKLKGRRVLLCGVSYLPDLADTRSSPTEMLRDALVRVGAVVSLHDPLVAHWPEHDDVPIITNLRTALAEAEAVVFAVPHREYQKLTARWLLTAAPQLRMVVDAQNIMTDTCAAALHQAGCRVSGVGKGHWRSSGYHKSP